MADQYQPQPSPSPGGGHQPPPGYTSPYPPQSDQGDPAPVPVCSVGVVRRAGVPAWAYWMIGLGVVVLIIGAVAGGLALGGAFASFAHPKAAITVQQPVFNVNYPPVDSIACDQLEQTTQHLHAYVSIYVNGKSVTLPANIGIPQDASGFASCYYWLHTHDTSGVIHIEAPANRLFTFGQFVDEWHQRFASLGFPQELLKSGWKIWVNGQTYSGILASIPLNMHTLITLAYNSPGVQPVTTYSWNGL